MDIFYTKEEFEKWVTDSCSEDFYDMDLHELIEDFDYTYPILVDIMGYTGPDGETGLKIYSKNDISMLKKFIDIC